MGGWEYQGLDGAVSDEQRTKWSTRQTAEEGKLAALKREQDDRKADPMFDALAPIRAAYKKTNVLGKRAILAKVLEYIQR